MSLQETKGEWNNPNHFIVIGLGNPDLEGMSTSLSTLLIPGTILSFVLTLICRFLLWCTFFDVNSTLLFIIKFEPSTAIIIQFFTSFCIVFIFFQYLSTLLNSNQNNNNHGGLDSLSTIMPSSPTTTTTPPSPTTSSSTTLLSLIQSNPYTSTIFHTFSGTRHNIGKDLVVAAASLCKAPLVNHAYKCRYSNPIKLIDIPIELFGGIIPGNTFPTRFPHDNRNKNNQQEQNYHKSTEDIANNDDGNATSSSSTINTPAPASTPVSNPINVLISTTSIPANDEQPYMITFAHPTTYMNNSGNCVSLLVRELKIPITNIIVVHDDMDLAIGTIFLRNKGSSGGHNGVGDIIEKLKKYEKERLKMEKNENKQCTAQNALSHQTTEENNQTNDTSDKQDIPIHKVTDNTINFIRFRLGIGRPGETTSMPRFLPGQDATLDFSLDKETNDDNKDDGDGQGDQHQQPKRRIKHSIPQHALQPRPKASLTEIQEFVLGRFNHIEQYKMFPTQRLFLSTIFQVIVLGVEKAQNNVQVLVKAAQREQRLVLQEQQQIQKDQQKQKG